MGYSEGTNDSNPLTSGDFLMEKVLDSVDVWFESPHGLYYVNATPNEAMALMSMPCMAGIVCKLIPVYALPPVPEPEN